MIVRQGFVSNSSSSSFMVGIGVVPSNRIKEFQDKLVEFKKSDYEYSILTLADLIEKNKRGINISEKTITINGGGNNGMSATISIDPDENAHYFIMEFNNDEGDIAFDCDGWDIDYDIDITWFEPSQRELWDMLNSLPNSDAHFGAERNG